MTNKQELYHEWIKGKFAEDRERYELDSDRRDPLANNLQVERERQREAIREYLKKV
jgi:hypothetical protein